MEQENYPNELGLEVFFLINNGVLAFMFFDYIYYWFGQKKYLGGYILF